MGGEIYTFVSCYGKSYFFYLYLFSKWRKDRKGTFRECVNNLMTLNSVHMLMTPKLKSPAWAFPRNSRSVYATAHWYFHLDA